MGIFVRMVRKYRISFTSLHFLLNSDKASPFHSIQSNSTQLNSIQFNYLSLYSFLSLTLTFNGILNCNSSNNLVLHRHVDHHTICLEVGKWKCSYFLHSSVTSITHADSDKSR